jgi:hypothetical protein
VKRFIALTFFLGAVCTPFAAAAQPHQLQTGNTVLVKQVPEADLAPADQYFGVLKLSILGINNTIRDTGLRYDVNHDAFAAALTSASDVEEAIRDWEHKYPRDTQIPHSVFLLQRLYTKILTVDSRDRAQRTATWLLHDFGGSPQAKQLQKILVIEHLAPLPPRAPEVDPPAPDPSPSP